MATDPGVRNDWASGASLLWYSAFALIRLASFLSSARCAEPLAPSSASSGDNALAAITGNPAAENQLPGTGLAGRMIHLPEDSGLRLGGLWLADTNGCLSGGAQPGEYFGLGFTGFGLVPYRPDDSLGIGMAWSCLNPSPFGRYNELMFQGYYQAHFYAGTFFQPALSYMPLGAGVAPSYVYSNICYEQYFPDLCK